MQGLAGEHWQARHGSLHMNLNRFANFHYGCFLKLFFVERTSGLLPFFVLQKGSFILTSTLTVESWVAQGFKHSSWTDKDNQKNLTVLHSSIFILELPGKSLILVLLFSVQLFIGTMSGCQTHLPRPPHWRTEFMIDALTLFRHSDLSAGPPIFYLADRSRLCGQYAPGHN